MTDFIDNQRGRFAFESLLRCRNLLCFSTVPCLFGCRVHCSSCRVARHSAAALQSLCPSLCRPVTLGVAQSLILMCDFFLLADTTLLYRPLCLTPLCLPLCLLLCPPICLVSLLSALLTALLATLLLFVLSLSCQGCLATALLATLLATLLPTAQLFLSLALMQMCCHSVCCSASVFSPV